MNVQQELKKLGVKPVKGQNFLTSETVVEALVEAGEVEGGKVLEIGAGLGVITEKLAEKAEKVYAVEKDSSLASYLREKFEGDTVEVVGEDILEYEIPGVERCVSNLPFQVSSEVLEILGKRQIQSSLILQEELADKIIAEPGSPEYGFLTVTVNYYFIPVKLQDVPSNSYFPEPEVDTSIVKLYPNRERHRVEDEERFFEVSKALFTHKRKKVRNAFVDSRHMLGMEKDEAKQLRDRIPHSEERVNQLDIRSLSDTVEFLSKR